MGQDAFVCLHRRTDGCGDVFGVRDAEGDALTWSMGGYMEGWEGMEDADGFHFWIMQGVWEFGSYRIPRYFC